MAKYKVVVTERITSDRTFVYEIDERDLQEFLEEEGIQREDLDNEGLQVALGYWVLNASPYPAEEIDEDVIDNEVLDAWIEEA